MTIKMTLASAHRAAKDKADILCFKTAFSQHCKYENGEFGERVE